VIATARVRVREHANAWTHAALAAACYIPLLLSAHGRVAADTRQAVYLDPGRFLSDALSMWDPSRDLGTVTHQNIVLVWPMGVYYWFTHALGIPVWFAQRVWLGSILFAAGAGVLYLARTIRWPASAPGVGPVVAAVAYAMSPYVLQYGTRTSVLLLPWAALPWLIGFTARSLETKGWRHPALFALVTLSIAVNATALALAMVGPALWIVWVVWGTRDVQWRDAWRAVLRIGVLTAITSSWWIVALLIEGKYGLPLLKFTETIEQVASTSSATEILRGLGYWVPYLTQHDFPEVSGAHIYTENLLVMGLQFGVVVATFVGILTLRWRHRVFFGALVIVGVVVGMGAYPTTSPSPLSSVFEDFARSSGIGLALRSTTRASPLALLGLAFLLGAFVDALSRRARRTGVAISAVAVVVAILLAPSVAGAELVDPLYSRPESLPDYWTQAIAAADRQAGEGRMLEIPGTRYAAYRWGNTYEPITAGLATTPTTWREQIPYGGAGSAQMLVALDNRLQEGLLDPRALAPVARLLGVSQILVRNDLAFERYDTVSPDRVWSLVSTPPPGLGTPQGFGPVGTNVADPSHHHDDQPVAADPTATYPALALVPVKQSAGLVQVVPVSSTVVLDGDADGIVDAATAGAIDGRAPILYAATAAQSPVALQHALDAGARIVLTDTNRRRVQRWRTIKDTTGPTLRADQDPAHDDGGPGGEAELDVFPGAGSDWQTVAVQHGAEVSATRFGNPLDYEARFRPAAALDGDPATAWQVGPTIGGIGDRLTVKLDHPVHTDHLSILGTDDHTTVTAVDIRFDDGRPIRVALDESSRRGKGQEVRFPARSFSKVSFEIADETTTPGTNESEAGIAELSIPGVTFDQVVRLPTALTGKLGAKSRDVPLSIVLTRQRGDTTKVDFQEEPNMARSFRLPTARAFSLSGQVRPATSAGPAAVVAGTGECRSDLVEIDGTPIPVEVRDDPAPTATGTVAPLTLVACDASVPLTAGRHELRTSADAPFTVDQLLLSSDVGGEPSNVDADGRPVLPPAPPATPVRWTQDSNSKVSVKAGATHGPSWLILGQSYNEGWEASTGGAAADPRGPVLINGFANGWYVPAARPGGASYSLVWVPQRTMNLALVVSLVAILGALVLLVRGRRWRAAGTPPTPELDAPWGDRPQVPVPLVVGAATGIGIVSALVIGPLWGVAAGALVVVAGRWKHGHALLTGGSVVALVIAFGLILEDRLGRRHSNSFFFSASHTSHRLALLAIALLGADLLFGRLRPRSTPRDPIADLRALWSSVSARLAAVGAPRASDGEVTVQTDDAEPLAPVVGARRFMLACVAGAVTGALLFVWMLTAGSFRLFAWHPTADFYDAQAHRLLSGHLDIPASTLGIEAFVVHGKAYMYQGPWPAMLRFPIALFTHSLDGRLGGLSMLLAFLVAAAAISLLTWQVRGFVRGRAAVTRGEAIGVAAFVFACTGGSIMVFEASQVSVYHESAMWGIALALATVGALVRHVTRPARWTLCVTAALTTLTLLSRASLGLGMLVALGLVLVGELLAWWRARRDAAEPRWSTPLRPHRTPSSRAVLAALAACVVPVVIYAGINVAKFDTPFSVPWDRQAFTDVSSARRAFLADNGGTFFGAQFVPTTVVSYLRPDAFELDRDFPWIGFNPSLVGRTIGYGGVRFDKIDATGSVPVSFPLLSVLAVAGVLGAVVVRRRYPLLARMWGPLAGAAVAAATIFAFGFIAQRYLGDVLPFLVLAGAMGFVLLVRALDGLSHRARVGTIAVLVVLGLGATWVTFAQAVWYQRLYQSPSDEQLTREFIQARADIPSLPAGPNLTPVRQGAHLPTRGAAGDLFVVGDCDGLYVSDGSTVDELQHTNWKPVARTPAVGAFDVDLRFGNRPAGTTEALLVGGTPDAPQTLSVEYLGSDMIRFRTTGSGLTGEGPAVHVTPDKWYHVQLSADPETDFSLVKLGDRTVWSGFYSADAPPRLVADHNFRGDVRVHPESKALCREVLRN
jgi:hypothetical protein